MLREEKAKLRILSDWVTEKMTLFPSQVVNIGDRANWSCGA